MHEQRRTDRKTDRQTEGQRYPYRGVAHLRMDYVISSNSKAPPTRMQNILRLEKCFLSKLKLPYLVQTPD